MQNGSEGVPESARDDVPTVCAIAVIAVCVTTFAHEALGHGSACLLLGGRITQLTSVYFHCSVRGRAIAPAGPAGNFLAGILSWFAQHLVPRRASAARLLALLVMALSFFWEAGYLVFSMVTGYGDYYFAGQDLFGNPQMPWRVMGIFLGVSLYLLFAHVLGICVTGFTTGTDRVSLLLGSAWLAAWIAACLAAALYAPDRGAAFTQAAGEIGAAFPLLYPFNRVRATGSDAAPPIRRSYAWVGAAVVVYAIFAATLGRGIS